MQILSIYIPLSPLSLLRSIYLFPTTTNTREMRVAFSFPASGRGGGNGGINNRRVCEFGIWGASFGIEYYLLTYVQGLLVAGQVFFFGRWVRLYKCFTRDKVREMGVVHSILYIDIYILEYSY